MRAWVIVAASFALVVGLADRANTASAERQIIYGIPLDQSRSEGAFAISPNGTDRSKIVHLSPVWDPTWADDGATVYFVSEQPGTRSPEIYIAAVGSATATPITDDLIAAFGPQVAPDSNRIVFFGYRPGSDQDEVYTISLASGRRQRLTHNAVLDFEPAWSPDGKIVWIHDDELWIMGGRGQRPHPLGDGFGVLDPRMPDWAPHGRSILFASGSSIRRVRPDGSHLRTVALTSGSVLQRPVWSGDGRRIAYTETRYGQVSEEWSSRLFVVRPDGTGRRLVRHHAMSHDW